MYMKKVISCQPSAVSHQQSAISSQPSVLSSQFSVLRSWRLGVKLFVLIIIVSRFIGIHCYSQVGVGINTAGAPANSSSILDVSSTTQGQLVPRMTTAQRTAIASPIESLLIYNTDTHCFEAYYNGGWVAFGCLSGCPVPSQPSAIAGTGSVCQSQSGVAFSVTNVTGVSYTWAYSGTGFSIGSGSGTNSISANYSGTATSGTLSVTGSTACGSSTAQTLGVTVNATNAVSISIAASPSGAICSGNSVTFTATATNGGSNPSYQWYKNGVTAGTNSSVYSFAPNNSDYVTCQLTSNISCSSGNPATSNQITETVTSSAVSVSIAANPSGAICTGTSVTFTATPTNGGSSPSFQWYKNGVTAGTNSSIYSFAPNNSDYVTCQLTSNISCSSGNPATSNQITETVNSVPAAPTILPGTTSTSQIIWNWAPYNILGQWNTTDTYPGVGINMAVWGAGGMNQPSAYIQTGLPCGSNPHTLYVWTSNSCGHSASTALTQNTVCTCSGTITTVAGIDGVGCAPTTGACGDGGAATSATLNFPEGVAVDAAANIYIADAFDFRIRKVTSGTMSTAAGSGTQGYLNGAAATARFNFPVGVAVNSAGTIIYIADEYNAVVRKVTGGSVTTFAGTYTNDGSGDGVCGYSGDGGPATAAQLCRPTSVAVDASGNVYIADGQYIRKVTTAGIISTVAGNGGFNYTDDGIAATSVALFSANGVAVDGSGNIYIAEYNGQRVRKVTVSTGIIKTIAGTGPYTPGYSGDGGPATAAQLNYPWSVAVDGSGNVFITDINNYVIRKVNTSGNICTYAGSQIWTGGFTGENVSSVSVTMTSSYGVAVDGAGNVYFSNSYNNRNTIRKVAP